MIECLLCKQNFVAEFSFIKTFSLKKYNQIQICSQCQKKFKGLGGVRCDYCSKKLTQAGICTDCLAWQKIYGQNLLINHAIYSYNRVFHDLMVAYKRYGDYVLKTVLQNLISVQIKKMKYDYYVPIPTAPEHQKRRQFDTISAIYSELVPLSHFLIKQNGTSAQGEKSKRERLLTEQGFLIDKETVFRENINKDKFLLLDDIYTTGRTLYHARDKLLEIFPKGKIESFTICH